MYHLLNFADFRCWDFWSYFIRDGITIVAISICASYVANPVIMFCMGPLKFMFLTVLLCFPLFQLMEIVSAFGQLAAYRFIFNEDLGGRCAFLEVWNSCYT